MKTYHSHSAKDTVAIGVQIGKTLPVPAFVLLDGDMGMGKTTLTRGIAKAFGAEDEVSSPTFALVNEYHGGALIYHFDLYRLSGLEDLESIGYFDYLDQPAILLFEWPERIPPEALPQSVIRITLRPDREDGRIITVE